MTRAAGRAHRGPTLLQDALLTIGTRFGLAVLIFATDIVLAHLLGPSAKGRFALVLLTSQFAAVVVGWGMDSALGVVSRRDAETARRGFANALIWSIVVGGFLVVRLAGIGLRVFVFFVFGTRRLCIFTAAAIIAAVDVGPLSLASQARLVGFFGGRPAVFQLRQLRLDLIEFRCRDDELILVRKNQFNILLRHLDAIAGRWMRAEHLRHASRPRAFLRLELFEEAHGSARIVSRLVEILQSEIIGFRFVLPRELQELHRNEESCGLAECEPADAAHEDQRN